MKIVDQMCKNFLARTGDTEYKLSDLDQTHLNRSRGYKIYKGGIAMYRRILFWICIVGLLAPLSLSWGDNNSFRNSKWGMSKEEVTALEVKMDPVEVNKNTIKYKTQILGKNVELIYLFSQNKLAAAAYILEDNYLNSKHFLNTYRQFTSALTQKYGPPEEEKINWLNDRFRNENQKRGLALSLGHMEYFASWETASSIIRSSLKEKNHDVLCLIEYQGKGYPHLPIAAKADGFEKEDVIDPF